MAGLTALNKMLREKAAFGGIMGRDGRRQYGGGSDMGQVGDSDGKTGPGTGGYQGGPVGGYGDARSDNRPSPRVREKEKAKYEKQFGGVSPTGSRPMGLFDRINKYNTDYQKKANIKLAQKRAFQKYQDIEQYADLMDDYGLTAEELAAAVEANPSYGYDFSNLDKGLATLTSNRDTRIESTRPNLYDVNSKLKGRFSILNPMFNKIRPDTQVTALNTLNKARNYNTLAMDSNISREKLDALANFGKTPDQINPRDTDGNVGAERQVYLPYPLTPEEQLEEKQKEFAYRFGNNQNMGADVTRASYIFNQGGRVPRAFGGIMDSATGRKAYGLGSIFKSVGKAAKKVLSSDIGKAAIAGAAIYYGGGGSKFFGGEGFKFGNLFNSNNKLLFSAGTGKNAGKQVFNPLKFAGLTTAIGAMAGPAKVDQMPGDDGSRGGRLIDPLTGEEGTPSSMRANIENAKIEADGDPVKLAALNSKYNNMLFTNLPYAQYGLYANGGRIAKAEGGLMNLGGMEKDYRAEGGFVPIGKQEKADDVPARLSVNEFVFTADAVRNAGGGDIDKGAEVMENMMKNLENGGRVSEESQGNTGAQEMFSVSERIGEVI